MGPSPLWIDLDLIRLFFLLALSLALRLWMGIKGKSKEASILSDVYGGSFRVFKQSLPAEDNNWKVKINLCWEQRKKICLSFQTGRGHRNARLPFAAPPFPPLGCPPFSPLFLPSLLSSLLSLLLRKCLLLLRGAFLGL